MENLKREFFGVDSDMEMAAIGIVADYIKEHLDKSDCVDYFEVYVVWKCKTLQNWKFLISSSLNQNFHHPRS